MSSPPPEPLPPAPEGHVGLVVILEPRLYLEIPISQIRLLCLKPLKYLIFLGWCILGREGRLAPDRPDCTPLEDLSGELVDGGLYYYILTPMSEVEGDLDYVVDLEVIKMESAVPSEITTSRNDFHEKLLERDGFCVFSGAPADVCQAAHIIPYARGSEWFQTIVQNRQPHEENVDNLTDINDVRNGLLLGLLHARFDRRMAVILKTPNHCLDVGDVPPCAVQPLVVLDPSVSYPRDDRYSLQWLEDPGLYMSTTLPYNLDAAFNRQSQEPKPSALLLHYNYGAAAVKQWGCGLEALKTHKYHTRPKAPEPVAMGPPKSQHDRIVKLDATKNPTSGEQHRDWSEGIVQSEHQTQWDEHDLMFFILTNSPAAKARRHKEEQEKQESLERWRQGIV
ncbi:hypothetical protein BS47DRAFT_1379266 [Hydnum rufescens UP504]|uniref:HNH nuclease domain-containing protein n=1 Tax=Hydnum rufescens UP504 TaxID=1448309 RepID=A0A9P6DYG6_9AGAM|nr:hypothetical protein BS47DRAFT_1379266 [Hydnum rufescens UP504]